MVNYHIFGLTLASDYSFANPLVRSSDAGRDDKYAAPDVIFTCRDRPPRDVLWESLTPAYASTRGTAAGQCATYVYRLDDCDVLRFAGAADFYLLRDHIDCHLLDPGQAALVEIQLLGAVLAFYLERRGVPTLHASAVVVDGRAVAFLTSSRGGKSALAAALMQAGHALLSDDLLALSPSAGRWMAQPGYPAMRMWPDEAAHFLGQHEDLALVHPAVRKRRVPVGPPGFGTFCTGACPLERAYVAERQEGAEGALASVERLAPSAALVALLRHSFAPRMATALGMERTRLPALAELVRAVSVRRLAYRGGFENLVSVRQTVLEDLKG